MKTVGIDIGTYSIKVAEVESNFKTSRIRDFYEIPLNHDPSQDVRLEKIEALKRIASQYDPKNYKICVGLSSEYVTQRVLMAPSASRKVILSSLAFQLEDIIPFNQEDAIFDFRIIAQKPNSAQILAFAVPKKHIQELLFLCEDAGLDPDIVCPDSVSLANIFEKFLDPVAMQTDTVVGEGTAQLVVHIGYNKTLINVMKDNHLLSSRAVYFGGKTLAQMISRSYSIPYLEALKGIAEKGFVLTRQEGADKDQIAFSEVVASGLQSLVSELKRTVIDLKAEFNFQFSQIYLMGGMGRLINLGPFLTQELEIPANVFSFLGQTLATDFTPTEEQDRGGAVAVGLALEALRRPKNPAINLRKNEFSKQGQNLKALWDEYKVPIQTGIALYFVLIVYSLLKISLVEDNMTALDQALKNQGKVIGLTSGQMKPDSLNKYITAKRAEIESSKEAHKLQKSVSTLDVVRAISREVPQKGQVTLNVTSWGVKDQKLTMGGTAANQNEVAQIKSALDRISILKSVKALPAPPMPGGRVAFQFEAEVPLLKE